MSAGSIFDRILSRPAVPEGQRHADILSRMKQLRANGMQREEAITAVASVYPIGSGERKITRRELADAYDGLNGQHLTPTIGRGDYIPIYRGNNREPEKPKIKPFQAKGNTATLPTDLAGTTPAEFLQRIYNPGDFISIVTPDDEGKPLSRNAAGVLVAVADELMGERPGHEFGFYFRINPIEPFELDVKEVKWNGPRPPDNARFICEHIAPGCGELIGDEDEDVSDYRFVLVELEVPKPERKKLSQHKLDKRREEFYAILLDSGLPIAAIYTSGGPSIHALVKANAKDFREYKERRDTIYAYCSEMPGLDQANKNPSRLSRLPGCMRGDQKQSLLSWDVGAASYEEWLDKVTPRLFKVTDLSELVKVDPILPPVLIDGWIHKGSIGMVTGSTKSNKSWTLIDLAICLAMELEWFGRQCKKSTVLYFDAEIQKAFWQKRFRILCDQRGLDPQAVADTLGIKPAFIAGKHISVIALAEELNRMHERGELDDVDLIIIDPIYQFYAEQWDENKNSDIAKIGKFLRFIAEFSDVGTIFAHHHTKGNQEGKRDIEKASGGGSFGRFIASSLAITHIGDEDSNKYTLGWTTSHFKPSPKQVAVREDFVWRTTDEDPKEAARKDLPTPFELASLLPTDGLKSSEWLQLAQETWPNMNLEDMNHIGPKCGQIVRFSKKDGDKWFPVEG